MSEVPTTTCPECDERFEIVFHNSYMISQGLAKLQCCPFCGADIDYDECTEKREQDADSES